MNTLSEYEVWLRDEYRPIRGGQDPEGGSEGGDLGGGEGSDKGVEKPVFKDLIDGKPIERWNDVYSRYKDYHGKVQQYSELGAPAEIKARIQKLQEWEKLVEEQRKQASMPEDEKQAAQNALKIEKELLKVAPWLANARKVEQLEAKIAQLEGDISGSKLDTIAQKASGELSEMLKESRIDAKYQSKIEDFLFSQMTAEEQKQFAKGDFSRMKEIFNEELNSGLLSAYKKGPRPPEPPVRHKPGGTPPRAKDAKPKTLDDATNDAWAKISG